MRVYITKYALTQGILVREGEICLGCHVVVGDALYGPADWYETEEAARARVAVMAKRKRAALQRQLQKLESFEPKLVEE